ncbi:MAG: 3-hydroxyacyl-CoA dehydrogenase NAD-binding domain-containing protein [Pseudomonadota bacterium]
MTLEDYLNTIGTDAWEVPGLPPGSRPVTRVGIIGAGTMGGGIAMNFANAGLPVRILETTQEALDRGLATVRRNYQRSADRGRFPHDEVDVRMGRLAGTLTMDDLADCDLIIEAVFENMEIKEDIFGRLTKIAPAGAILATNTSALDIDQIARATDRPGDVIGMHFFSPANVMKLLEVVRARETADDVVATAMGLAKTIGKVAVLVGVCPGFVGNRMLFARQRRATQMLYEGLMPWDVDAALNEFGFRMGPFQMSDLAGLDIGWRPGQTTDNPIRDALCEQDRRGQKTGAGFYDYAADRSHAPSPVAEAIIRDITGASPKTIARDQITAELICPMINEAVKLLEENKTQRPGDVDVVWLNGYGWPAERGGPMWFGDSIGAGEVLAVMDRLAVRDDSFAPAALLRDMAARGAKFTDIDTGGLKV